MYYILQNNTIKPIQSLPNSIDGSNCYVSICTLSQWDAYLPYLGLIPRQMEEILHNATPRFESREGLDIACFSMLSYNGSVSPYKKGFLSLQKKNFIFLNRNFLFIFSDKPQMILKILSHLSKEDLSDMYLGKVLIYFLDWLIKNDNKYIDILEKTVVSLEDEIVLNKQNKNFIRCIISLRKCFMLQKRYYDEFLDIMGYWRENENQLLEAKAKRNLQFLLSKMNRTYQNILALRESVTQIREAYQAEVDINLNNTMKFFTVITTIFYPLSLIAGWYGMNFDMPEYRFPYSYPVLLTVSIIILVGLLLYFKKNRWF